MDVQGAQQSFSRTFSRIDAELAGLTKELIELQGEVRSLKSQLALAVLVAAREPPGIQMPVVETTCGPFHLPGYWAGGSFHRGFTTKEIYLGVLNHVWTVCPTTRIEIADLARRGARIRHYISENPRDLFPGKDGKWTAAHHATLSDGWYADTNLSARQMRQIVSRVLAAAGLKSGRDIEIVWVRRKAAI